MDAAAVGRTQAVDRAQSMEQQDIFDGMVCGLPALTRHLYRRGLGADDTPCGPVMGTREDAGTVAKEAGSSALGATTVAASASETSSRGAQAVRERAGESPGRAAPPAAWGGGYASMDGFCFAYALQVPLGHLEGVGLQGGEQEAEPVVRRRHGQFSDTVTWRAVRGCPSRRPVARGAWNAASQGETSC